MRKLFAILLILAVPTVFLIGCATDSQEQGIKCPKCGNYFNTKEGAEFLKSGQGRY